jgi:hypothetical protein
MIYFYNNCTSVTSSSYYIIDVNHSVTNSRIFNSFCGTSNECIWNYDSLIESISASYLGMRNSSISNDSIASYIEFKEDRETVIRDILE